MCIMAISCVAVCFSVIVLNVRHGGERRQKVPNWLQFIADRLLAPIFCFPSANETEVKAGNDQSASVNRAFHALSTYIVGIASNQQNQNRRNRRSSSILRDSITRPFVHRRVSSLANKCQMNSSDAKQTLLTGLEQSLPIGDSASGAQSSGTKRVSIKALDQAIANSRLKNIINRTAILMNRFEQENENEDTVAEWQRVARIFDQFFFWTVFLLTMLSTLAMFVIGFSHQAGGKKTKFAQTPNKHYI